MAWKFRIKPLIEAYFLVPGMRREAQRLINDIDRKLLAEEIAR